jgi:hypothetical protein
VKAFPKSFLVVLSENSPHPTPIGKTKNAALDKKAAFALSLSLPISLSLSQKTKIYYERNVFVVPI